MAMETMSNLIQMDALSPMLPLCKGIATCQNSENCHLTLLSSPAYTI